MNKQNNKQGGCGWFSLLLLVGAGVFLWRTVTIRSFANHQYWYVGKRVCPEALNNASVQIRTAHFTTEQLAKVAPKQARQLRDQINTKEIVQFNAKVCD